MIKFINIEFLERPMSYSIIYYLIVVLYEFPGEIIFILYSLVFNPSKSCILLSVTMGIAS